MTTLTLLRVTPSKSKKRRKKHNVFYHLHFVVSTHAENYGFVCWDFVFEIYASTPTVEVTIVLFALLKALENYMWKTEQQSILLETVSVTLGDPQRTQF